MNCCLWLNRVKVWNCADIKNNFDLASLGGYFRGGSLVRWLKANGGIEEARKLEETGNIEYAFGIINEIPVGCVAHNAPLEPQKPADITGTMWASFPTSGSGSGSGCLGYGLHII